MNLSIRRSLLLLAWPLAFGFIGLGSEYLVAADGEQIDFATEIRPILSDKCFFCHGPDAAHRQADLRLDLSPEDQAAEPVIVAGDRAASLVWQRINDRDDPMPPLESHKSLIPEEIELLGRWIDQGAAYEAHWAYAPVVRPSPPSFQNDEWSHNAVDRFLLAKLQRHKLRPSEQAQPARLLRRVYLDLIGLPPTPEQVAAFESDPSRQAYAKVVDELLRSPRFGEHWAIWWLDLVRYGDSVGFHGDQPRSIWPYRDWVINAFNMNMPFDEFTRFQLAGDLIKVEGETKEEKTLRLFASAYNRLGPVTAEGGAQAKEYRAIYAADRVANFGEVWLASSTGCARCHDHKYDPFTAQDFYSLAAVFEDIDHSMIANRTANIHWGPYQFFPQNDQQAAQIEEIEKEYNDLLAKYPEAGAYQTWTVSRDAGPAPPHGPWGERIKELFKQRDELAKTIPVGQITRSLPTPRIVRLLPRGNWLDDSGPIMKPRVPHFLGGEVSKDEKFSRLDLANWLFEKDHPLTSRVVVNRLWSRFFGRGISSNTLEFGNQGQPPTHRELLDWLAVEFRENHWDMQHVMRLLVLSKAYQQSASQSDDLVAADPDNRWFARQSALRLPAEVLRDQALYASGLLVNKLGGPSVFPYQPRGHWAALNFPKRSYQQSHGDDLYRRSVYTWVQRTFPHPAMTNFDAPNRESCTALRSETNTPLQALTLLNEPLYVETARNLAQTAILASPEHDQRVDSLFERVLLRTPTESEKRTIAELFAKHQSYFENHPDRATALVEVGESKPSEQTEAKELATYTSLARVVLNLHETVTKP